MTGVGKMRSVKKVKVLKIDIESQKIVMTSTIAE